MIYLGSDHAGFALKEYIKAFLKSAGHEVTDMGAKSYVADDDYPDYIIPVAKAVSENKDAVGIIFGKSGQGEAMTANSLPHVRAAVYYGGKLTIPELARKHNNANVLSLGAGFVSKAKARKAVKLFLETEFTHEKRHVRRLAKEGAV